MLESWIAVRLETVYVLGGSGLAHLPGEPDHLLLMRPDLLAAVQASLDIAYARAKDLLTANRSSLDALATALFERGYLDAAEIEAVLQATPPLEPTSPPKRSRSRHPRPRAREHNSKRPTSRAATPMTLKLNRPRAEPDLSPLRRPTRVSPKH